MPFPLHLIRLRAALVVGLAVLAGAPAAASAAFTPGARSLGDSLFPTIGNGGYDVRHYDLDLDYAVAKKRLEGTATIDAVATQGLSRFSFDLTAWNKVRSVSVGGRPARFVVDAKRSKLTITPPQRDSRRAPVSGRRALRRDPAAAEGNDQPQGGLDPGREDRSGRRRPARRGDGLVPEQQRPRRQGDLHDPHHRSPRLERPRHRRPDLPAERARQEHVRVEGDRPDVDLPRVRLGRQVRRQLAQPGQAGQDQARRRQPEQAGAVLHRDHRRAARGGQEAVGRRPRSLVRDRRLLLRLLRQALPVHVAGRDRDPAGLRPQPRDPGQVHVRHHQDRQHLRTRGRGRRARGGASVLRQPRDARALARRLAQRGHGGLLRVGVVVHRHLLPDPAARPVPRRLRQRPVPDLLARPAGRPGEPEGPVRRRRHVPPRAGHDRGDPRDPRQRHDVQGDDAPLADRPRVRQRHDRAVHRAGQADGPGPCGALDGVLPPVALHELSGRRSKPQMHVDNFDTYVLPAAE